MYSEFYGFAGEAFGEAPDPQFYFDSLTHRKAMSYLGYGLKQGEGFIVITGEHGAGKTMLVEHLRTKLDQDRIVVAVLGDEGTSRGAIADAVAAAFGIESVGEGASAASQVEAFLHHKARDGQRVLLVVDDCQRLSVGALQDLRVLTSSHLGTHPLMQTLLLGQPEFKRLLSQTGQLAALRERVIAAHNLGTMQPGELESYATHRLGKVGWSGVPEFHRSIWLPLHKLSGGNPRRINALLRELLEMGAREELSLLKPDLLGGAVPVAEDEALEPVTEPVIEKAPVNEAPVQRAKPRSAGLAGPQLQAIQQAFSERDRAYAKLRREVAELKGTSAGGVTPDSGSVAERLAAIEARLDEQDAALKQVMAALVELLETSRGRHAA